MKHLAPILLCGWCAVTAAAEPASGPPGSKAWRACAEGPNRHYPVNPPPLQATKFVALPLGAVKPQGWLKTQLTIQANGLTGHLDEFWPSLVKTGWKGGDGESWERGPYFLDGLVPLAYLLDDPRLLAKTKHWLEGILASGQPNGWFGPAQNKDRWPLAVAMKVLSQYHEATGDPRALELLKNYFAYLHKAPPDWPHKDWRGVRAMENAVTAYWLYRRTGDQRVLEVTESIQKNSRDWISYFTDFPWTTAALNSGKVPYDWKDVGMTAYVVNVAMATKYPGLWWQQSGDARHRQAVYRGWANLDEHHGQVGGRFSGDEHLSGKRPTQGTELCAVVESMFSLEKLIEIFGDAAFADRLEMLAYNANPGACTPDYWAHQYDQQANQVLCSVAKRQWSTNSDTSNLYGLEPHYGCCTANMHQGWPKFVSHLWMATHDQGLAAVAYGPSIVRAKVGAGSEVTIAERTDYPFDETIRFQVTTAEPVEFSLHLRVPGWAEAATLVHGETRVLGKPGQFLVVRRRWTSGDEVVLRLPMKVRAETRHNGATTILRGPLVYSLKIGERFEELKRHHPTLPVIDWAVHPATPWNYGLLLDRRHPEKSIQVLRIAQPGPQPFAQESASVVLRAKGRVVPDWKLEANSAGETPLSPVASREPLVDLELVPYGCTRLRISEFPVLAE
ncbi:MAG: hypothetical protein GX575_19960 [Candidatus Anammoximicrobium sp.]|nr:hypothetical protein [Candidatus Anammoximicrobium sp.]